MTRDPRPVSPEPEGQEGTSRTGVLADVTIKQAVVSGLLRIDPFNSLHVQPSSYDLTVALDRPLCLERGVFHLLSTVEWVGLPDRIQGQVHGRSSIGRKGVLVHFTAGFIDPGFSGQITLEVMALDRPVEILPGDRLAQIAFIWLDQAAEHPYKGRYQGQYGPTESRFQHGSA